MKPMVKLNDGTSVPLEVFNSWTPKKQEFKTRPLNEIRAIVDKIRKKTSRPINTPIGTFESINEAIIQTGLPYSRLRRYLLSTEHPEYSYVKEYSGNEKREPKIPTEEDLDATRIREEWHIDEPLIRQRDNSQLYEKQLKHLELQRMLLEIYVSIQHILYIAMSTQQKKI